MAGQVQVQIKRIIEEALRILRINSITTHGNEELVNFASFLMQTKGIKPQTQQVMHSYDDVSRQQFNIIGVLGDPLVDRKIKKGILLMAPLDTVSPGLKEHWNLPGQNPLSALATEDRLIGLGAASGKLDFLCKLHAAKQFVDRKLKMPIYVVGTCGHQVGAFGGKYLLQSLALNPLVTLVGAPTDLRLVRAHKSLSVFKVSIDFHTIEKGARGFNRKINLASFGRIAHGAFAQKEGVNAISQMVGFLNQAMENGFEIQFTEFLGGATAAGYGGAGVNQVPDEAQTEFFLTSHQLEDFKRYFRESVRAENLENAFKIEMGGLGDTGISFFPDVVFPCLHRILELPKRVIETWATENPAVGQGTADRGFDPPGASYNIGRICRAVGQASGKLEVWFEMRLPPDVSVVELLKRVEKSVLEIGANYPNLNLSLRRERMGPGLSVPEENGFVQKCLESMKAVDIAPKLAQSSLATETGLYFQKGYDALAFGPGSPSGSAHSPNESVSLKQIEEAVAFYTDIIEKVCT